MITAIAKHLARLDGAASELALESIGTAYLAAFLDHLDAIRDRMRGEQIRRAEGLPRVLELGGVSIAGLAAKDRCAKAVAAERFADVADDLAKAASHCEAAALGLERVGNSSTIALATSARAKVAEITTLLECIREEMHVEEVA